MACTCRGTASSAPAARLRFRRARAHIASRRAACGAKESKSRRAASRAPRGYPVRSAASNSRRRNDRDAIAAKRADPEFVADLDERRSGAELGRVGHRHDLAYGERARIDLDRFPALTGLPDGEQRAVARPMNVVDAETERDLVARRRRRAARDAKERLAAPRRDVKCLAVVGELDAVRAGRLAAGHLLPPRRGVPFPELAVALAAEHALRG